MHACRPDQAALTEIVALDRSHVCNWTHSAVLLLRTESVASSKIESVEASLEDYARALHGSRANTRPRPWWLPPERSGPDRYHRSEWPD